MWDKFENDYVPEGQPRTVRVNWGKPEPSIFERITTNPSDIFSVTPMENDVSDNITDKPETPDNGLGFFEVLMKQKEYDSLVSNPDAQNEPDEQLMAIRQQMIDDDKAGLIEIPTEPFFGPFVQYDFEAAHKKYPQYQNKEQIVQGIKDKVAELKPQIEGSNRWGAKIAGSAYSFLADDKNQNVLLATIVAPQFGLTGFVPKVLGAIAENIIGDVSIGGGVVPYAQKMGFDYDYKQQALDIVIGGTLAPVGIIGTQTLVKKMSGSAKQLGKAMNDLKAEGHELDPIQQVQADVLSQMDDNVTIAQAMKELSKTDGDIVDLRPAVEFHKLDNGFERIDLEKVEEPFPIKADTKVEDVINTTDNTTIKTDGIDTPDIQPEVKETLSYQSMLYKSDEELDVVFKQMEDSNAIADLNRIDVEKTHLEILEKCLIG